MTDDIARESQVLREMLRERDAVREMLGEILGRRIDPIEQTEKVAAEAVARASKPRVLAYFAEGPVWSDPIDMDEVGVEVRAIVEEMLRRGYDGGPIPLTPVGLDAVRGAVSAALEVRWPERFSITIRPPRRGERQTHDVMIYPRVHEAPLHRRQMKPGECIVPSITIDLTGGRP